MNPAAKVPRTIAREIAFQYLYQDDLNPRTAVSDVAGELDDFVLLQFVDRLLHELTHEEAPSPAQAAVDLDAYRRWQQSSAMIDFTRSLISGVRMHRMKIDQGLSAAAEHWTVDRMTATDRNVLRLGAYEILYTETHGRIVINEAVELAKRYGTAQSAQFVNGLLDRLLRERKGQP